MPLFANLAAVDRAFICQLCKAPWDPECAVACPQCEDVYCRACVEDNVLKGKVCLNSSCHLPFDLARCVPVHRTVRNLADSQVPVRCRHHLRSCAWQGARSALAAHEKECKFAAPVKPIFAQAVPEELICQICSEAMTDPLQVPGCQHLFCGVCLEAALAARQACPSCNGVADHTESVPKIIQTQLENLAVVCNNRDLGCTFTGTRRHFAGHAAVCTYNNGVVPTVPVESKATIFVKNEFAHLLAKSEAPQSIATVLHIDAPRLERIEDRKQPLCISAAIDVSGSMSGEKIELVRQSLRFMVEELTEQDSFGIVTFESQIQQVLPISRMTPEVKVRACEIISALRDLGSTDLHGGVVASIRQVSDFCSKAAAARAETPITASTLPPSASSECQHASTSNVVVLFTDGQANIGETDPTRIVVSLKNVLESAPTLSVYTFGFGADHNALLLQAIAEGTQGSYYYVKDAATLKDSFADCLGGLVSTVASNIKITLKVANEQTTVDRLLTKYTTTQVDTRTYTITIKDMYSSEARDIPVQLSVATSSLSPVDSFDLLEWDVTYTSAIDQQTHSFKTTSSVSLSETKIDEKSDMHVDEQRNRFLVAEAMEEARKEAEAHRFAEAQARMDTMRQTIQHTVSANSATTTLVMTDALQAQAMMSASMYGRGGSQALSAAVSRHHQQRCNDVSEEAMYGSSWRADMKKKSKK